MRLSADWIESRTAVRQLMQSNKVQSIVSVLRFLFTVVFYLSMDCLVLQCFEQSPHNLIP